MLLKVLISLATVGGVAGAATAFALKNGSSHFRDNDEVVDSRTENQENTDAGPKVIEEETETRGAGELEQQLVSVPKEEPKIKFEGKLVFNRTTKKQLGLEFSNSMTVFYQGELLSEQDYKIKKEEWEKPEPEDSEVEHDPEDHITIDLSPEKTQKTESQLKEYLKDLNEKLEKETQDSDRFDKLKKLLEENRSGFEENFGTGSYDGFLNAIQKTTR